jgi:hypothetical protein
MHHYTDGKGVRMKKKYIIRLDGCDDSTYIAMELTEDQLEFVKLLCGKSYENSTYGCMPTMSVEEL